MGHWLIDWIDKSDAQETGCLRLHAITTVQMIGDQNTGPNNHAAINILFGIEGTSLKFDAILARTQREYSAEDSLCREASRRETTAER